PCGRAAERERPTPRRRGRCVAPGRTTPSRRLRDSSGYSPSVPSSESSVSHDTAFLDHFHKALAGGTPSAPSGLGVITRDLDHDGAGLESKRVAAMPVRSEEHTSELQSRENLVCRLLLEKKKT